MRFGALACVLLLAACGAKTGLEESKRAPPAGDGGVDSSARDAGDGLFPVRPSMQCLLDGPNATVIGVTPLGAFDLSFGWSGPQEGSCGGTILYFSSSPAPLESESGLLVPLRDGLMVGPAFTTAGGMGEVGVTALRDGEVVSARGLASTLEYAEPGDDPRGDPTPDGFCHCDPSEKRMCSPSGRLGFIEGELFVEDEGWFIRGSFRLPHCHGLHAICF
jgi:hypothetical protein